MHMPIIDEYWYEFQGISNVPSRVHIRLVHEPGKPLVAICSQPIYGRGTSVQNAYEFLKTEVLGRVTARVNRERKNSFSKEFDDLAATVKGSKSLTTAAVSWLLQKLAAYLRQDTVHRIYLRPDLHLIWLEHWPGSDNLSSPDDYLMVREDQNGSPSWIRLDVGQLAEEIGYPENLLRKDIEIFTTKDPCAPSA